MGERYVTHLLLLLGLLETQGGQEAHLFPLAPVDLQVLLPPETPFVRGSHSVLQLPWDLERSNNVIKLV